MRQNVSDFNRTTNPSVLLQQLINIGIYQTHYGIAQVQFVGSISPMDIQFEKRGARLKSIVWHRIECKPLPPPSQHSMKMNVFSWASYTMRGPRVYIRFHG